MHTMSLLAHPAETSPLPVPGPLLSSKHTHEQASHLPCACPLNTPTQYPKLAVLGASIPADLPRTPHQQAYHKPPTPALQTLSPPHTKASPFSAAGPPSLHMPALTPTHLQCQLCGAEIDQGFRVHGDGVAQPLLQVEQA
jgi:hypothetical protein